MTEFGMNLFEGGNAKTKSGEIASKVNIKEFTDEQYESFKKRNAHPRPRG